MKRYSIFLLAFLIVFPVASSADVLSFNESEPSLNAVLSNSITFPPLLASIARVSLGLKASEPISFQEFVVLCALWIVILLIVAQALVLVPFFEGGSWKVWLASIAITILVALTGVLRQIAAFLLDVSKLQGLLDRFGITKLILVIGVLVLLLWGAIELIKLLKKQSALAVAHDVGLRNALK